MKNPEKLDQNQMARIVMKLGEILALLKLCVLKNSVEFERNWVTLVVVVMLMIQGLSAALLLVVGCKMVTKVVDEMKKKFDTMSIGVVRKLAMIVMVLETLVLVAMRFDVMMAIVVVVVWWSGIVNMMVGMA